MEQQLSLSEQVTSSEGQIALGANDQACNECRRRKGRCDKQLPECGPCFRNKRHCLYEKHSKTPLTRKHLTAVEERLRQAELRIRQAERRAQIADARLREVASQGSGAGDVPSVRSAPRWVDTSIPADTEDTTGDASATHEAAPEFVTLGWQYDRGEFDSHQDEHESAVYEAPPLESDDFSWDEQRLSERAVDRTGNSALIADDELSVVDGMASLNVEDRAGYLGVASGAAMLRLLLPDAEHRGALRKAMQNCAQNSSIGQKPTGDQGWVPTPVYLEHSIWEIDLDKAIDAYFSLYHLSYPIIHEPTFRAQYAQVIPRPGGKSWNALAYLIGAIGMFTTSTEPVTRDGDLFEAAKANISIDSLEKGNLTLVQVLVLMSNFLQKKGKPNSGYNYLGLALHMSMGLGLHKEFHNWQISPLTMEIRRRVWWCVENFAVGAMITFGRPLSWPEHGVEVAMPLNVDDRDLTNVSTCLPPAKTGITTYSAVSAQARFHLATNEIYSKVISVHFPSAAELVRLDDEQIEPWRLAWQTGIEPATVAPRYRLARFVMEARYRNFRIIMYRPFVIRQALQARSGAQQMASGGVTQIAIDRCLHEAKSTIVLVHDFWSNDGPQVCMSAWYALYFLFQASLIPCVCLRNDPMSPLAPDWRQQIQTVLRLLDTMKRMNPSARECQTVISRLCADFLKPWPDTGAPNNLSGSQDGLFTLNPVEESPQTQLSGVYSMMWPTANDGDVDLLMPDDAWQTFFAATDQPAPDLHDNNDTNGLTWNQQ